MDLGSGAEGRGEGVPEGRVARGVGGRRRVSRDAPSDARSHAPPVDTLHIHAQFP